MTDQDNTNDILEKVTEKVKQLIDIVEAISSTAAEDAYRHQAPPHSISEAEAEELGDFLCVLSRMDKEELGPISCYVAKFPNYITGGPGWTGDLYVMVWDGSPSYITVIGRDRFGLVMHANIGDDEYPGERRLPEAQAAHDKWWAEHHKALHGEDK